MLTDERIFERRGVVRRQGHDLPLRGVTDVVVSQRFTERLLGSGTLTVTTEGGSEFTVRDVPAVGLVQASLLTVADDVTARLLRPRRPPRAELGEPGVDDEFGPSAAGHGDHPDEPSTTATGRRPRRRPRRRPTRYRRRGRAAAGSTGARPAAATGSTPAGCGSCRPGAQVTATTATKSAFDAATVDHRTTRAPPRRGGLRRPSAPPPDLGTATTTRPRGRASCASRAGRDRGRRAGAPTAATASGGPATWSSGSSAAAAAGAGARWRPGPASRSCSARKLWRALGFANVSDTDVAFTDGDVQALGRVAALVRSGLVDEPTAIAFARALGQTSTGS